MLSQAASLRRLSRSSKRTDITHEQCTWAPCIFTLLACFASIGANLSQQGCRRPAHRAALQGVRRARAREQSKDRLLGHPSRPSSSRCASREVDATRRSVSLTTMRRKASKRGGQWSRDEQPPAALASRLERAIAAGASSDTEQGGCAIEPIAARQPRAARTHGSMASNMHARSVRHRKRWSSKRGPLHVSA